MGWHAIKTKQPTNNSLLFFLLVIWLLSANQSAHVYNSKLLVFLFHSVHTLAQNNKAAIKSDDSTSVSESSRVFVRCSC